MKNINQFLTNLFNTRPRFTGTPEAFLAMVVEMQRLNSNTYSEKEVQQFGDVMMKVYKVNLSPYRDFADLLKNGKPDEYVLKKVRDGMEATNKRIELKKALYGQDVDLKEDDIMRRTDASSIFARKVIKNMSKYVRFHEDDQKTIDDL